MPDRLLRVIVALDGSEESDAALFQALPLLASDRTCVTLLTAADPLPLRRTLRPLRGARDERLTDRAVRRGRDHQGAMTRRLAVEGVAVAERVVTVGEPVEVIARLAGERLPAIVVARPHRRGGLARWARGSVTSELLRRCPAPLLLLRGEQRLSGIRSILVPLDGSGCAEEIVGPVERLAAIFGSEIGLLTIHPTNRDADARRRLQRTLGGVAGRLRTRGLQVRTLSRVGDPTDWILRVREVQKFDLVAMTTHGLTGLRRVAFGSVAQAVLGRSPVPVLVLPVSHADTSHV